MRTVVAALMMATLTSVACADDGTVIAEGAKKCVPVGAGEDGTVQIKFLVRVNSIGEVIELSADPAQASTDGLRSTIESAARAIRRCAPYRVANAGDFAASVTLTPLSKKPTIDPFKPLSPRT